MTFRVEPQALHVYAGQLADAQQAAEAAKAYVTKWGSFSAHETGLLAMIWPNHSRFVGQLTTMLQHLADLADASAAAMTDVADHYARTDQAAEATIDAAYPAVPRTPVILD